MGIRTDSSCCGDKDRVHHVVMGIRIELSRCSGNGDRIRHVRMGIRA